MSIQIGTAGNALPLGGINLVSPQERLADREISRQPAAQARAAERRSAILEKFESSLPGNREPANFNTTVADLERIVLTFNRKLKFVVDHKSHEVTVKVIDSETDKVIRELPPEELQRLHREIKETIGFLFDERV
jgi:flagellar protein FlaG